MFARLRYTFAIVCIVCLVAIAATGLALLAAATPAKFMAVFVGMVFALVAEWWLLEKVGIALKDYFLWGLPLCVLVAAILVVKIVGRLTYTIRESVLSFAFVRGLAIWGLILLASIVSGWANAGDDFRRILRLQVYLTGSSFVVAMAALSFLKLTAEKAQRSEPLSRIDPTGTISEVLGDDSFKSNVKTVLDNVSEGKDVSGERNVGP